MPLPDQRKKKIAVTPKQAAECLRRGELYLPVQAARTVFAMLKGTTPGFTREDATTVVQEAIAANLIIVKSCIGLAPGTPAYGLP
jgi:hypothetical protein